MISSSSSKTISYLIPVLAVLIFLVGAFWIGMAIGERRARHFNGWCDGYRHAFMPLGRGRMPLPSPHLPNAHGVFGRVVSVSNQNIVIQGNDDIEQGVLVTSSTAIRLGDRNATLNDIHTDDQVSVFGVPNSVGQIEARLVRLLPPPR